MSVQVEISYEQLLKAVQALPPQQRAALQKDLQESNGAEEEENPWAGMSLQELLLNGPTLTEEEIAEMEAAHEAINRWRE